MPSRKIVPLITVKEFYTFTSSHQLIFYKPFKMDLTKVIRLEEAAKFFFSFWLSFQLDFPWWLFFAWLLVPDISMLGYLINTRAGAFLYNLFHHQAVGILMGIAGLYLTNNTLIFAGIIIFGHSAFDRMLGYGLKYTDHFKHTHLGWIGKKDKQE